MTNPTPAPSTGAPMQFDRAVSNTGTASTAGVTCSMCNNRIVDRYWTLGDQPTCVSCKATVQREMAAAKSTSTFMRSSLYGFGAAIAGAILYYAILKITGWQLALVAIAIGYMVGRAMRIGARGWGGRRFQVAAAGLTYLSIGLAYMPIAFETVTTAKKAAESATVTQQGTIASADSTDAAAQDSPAVADSASLAAGTVSGDSTAVVAQDSTLAADSTAASDSAAAAAADGAAAPARSTASTATGKSVGIGMAVLGVGAAFVLALGMPIFVVLGTLPSGLISALIIGYGIRQAWRMTAGSDLSFQGPLTVAKG